MEPTTPHRLHDVAPNVNDADSERIVPSTAVGDIARRRKRLESWGESLGGRAVGLVRVISSICVVLATNELGQAQELVPPTARDLLVDVTASDWEQLAGSKQFDERDPVLLRIMRRLAQIDYGLLVRLAEPELPADPSQPPFGRLFTVVGDVVEVHEITVPASPDRPESGLNYFKLRLARDSHSSVDIVARELPDAWRGKLPTGNTRCGCRGFFLSSIADGAESIPLLATRRIEWFPRQVDAGVSDGLVRLGGRGVDVGMLDVVRARSGQKLDRDEMLFLIPAISVAAEASADIGTAPLWNVVELLKGPQLKEGSCGRLVGTVERITPIDVSQNPLAASWGLERYFQLDMFVSIGDRRLNIVDPTKSNSLTFDYDYPATAIVRSLPPELQAEDYSGRLIELPAFFYRLWSYPSIMSRRVDPERQLVAPLFVGGTIRVVASDSGPFSNAVTLAVALGVGGLAIFSVWLWRTGRGNRRRPVNPPPESFDLGD